MPLSLIHLGTERKSINCHLGQAAGPAVGLSASDVRAPERIDQPGFFDSVADGPFQDQVGHERGKRGGRDAAKDAQDDKRSVFGGQNEFHRSSVARKRIVPLRPAVASRDPCYVVRWAVQRVDDLPRVVLFGSVLNFDAYIKQARALGAVVTFPDPFTADASCSSAGGAA